MVEKNNNEQKLKALRPTLREKKRYMQYKVTSKQKLITKDMQKLIDNAILTYIGELGFAKAGIKHLTNKYDENNQTGIIKLSRQSQDDVQAALTLIRTYNNNDCKVEVIKTSGILKKIINGGK